MLDRDFPPPNLDDGVTLWWDSDGRFTRNEGDQTWTWVDNYGTLKVFGKDKIPTKQE